MGVIHVRNLRRWCDVFAKYADQAAAVTASAVRAHSPDVSFIPAGVQMWREMPKRSRKEEECQLMQ
jgi:hypothetical protein